MRRWDVVKVDERAPEAYELLAAGWEPFAVVPLAPVDEAGNAYCTVWMRREVDDAECSETVVEPAEDIPGR